MKLKKLKNKHFNLVSFLFFVYPIKPGVIYFILFLELIYLFV